MHRRSLESNPDLRQPPMRGMVQMGADSMKEQYQIKRFMSATGSSALTAVLMDRAISRHGSPPTSRSITSSQEDSAAAMSRTTWPSHVIPAISIKVGQIAILSTKPRKSSAGKRAKLGFFTRNTFLNKIRLLLRRLALDKWLGCVPLPDLKIETLGHPDHL